MSKSPRNTPRLLAPEVVQTSAMDCGPASLKALLEGFGISVSYGRLREACQTDVDGTSIDTLEETAVQLGLDAEQVMIPVDHLLVPEAEALPTLVVTRQPNGVTHFVVAWKRMGRFIQLMDPATGRRWVSARQFLANLYVHHHLVPDDAWRDWAGSDDFTRVLRQRQRQLKLSPSACQALIDKALADTGWYPLATLDAATRMTTALVEAGGIRRGPEAERVLQSIFGQALQEIPGESVIIPRDYWSVRPAAEDPDGEAQLWFVGAVLVRVRGRRTAPPEEADTLSPELMAALTEPPSRPGRDLLRLLREDGVRGLSTMLLAL
ncbi:MAG: cysteine peptidase family C39 domain-containing protein, partial [Rhodothermales bacterium]